jgi:hypothetical protein
MARQALTGLSYRANTSWENTDEIEEGGGTGGDKEYCKETIVCLVS